MTAEQLLQESIIALQKQDLRADTRHLVDEAAQLLADGREMEARAVVEKAQAIAGSEARYKPNGAAKPSERAAEKTGPAMVSQISAGLAQGIANAVSEALEELQRSFGADLHEVAASVDERLAEMTGKWKALSHLAEQVDRMEREATARAGEDRERWDGIAATVAAIEGTGRALRVEAEQLAARVTAQAERIEGLDRLLTELSPKVSAIAEQVARHTDSLRLIGERRSQRVAALNEALDAIARLREPKALANEVAAG